MEHQHEPSQNSEGIKGFCLYSVLSINVSPYQYEQISLFYFIYFFICTFSSFFLSVFENK